MMNGAFNQKKVSVIIPTYNRAKFIPNAVKSVVEQNYDNIEIIIVDDGSNDNTEAIVDSLKEKHPNIIYCCNEHSKGPSGARNTGIAKASGDYLSFLDSDDVWLDGHLVNGVKILDEHPEIDVLFGNFSVVDFSTGKRLYNFFDQKKLLHSLKSVQLSPGVKILRDNLFIALIKDNFFSVAGAIFRKSTCSNIFYDESVMFAEDRDFAIKLYKRANATFAFREDPVFIAYRHESNICNSLNANNRQQILETHIHLYTKYLTVFNLSDDERKILTGTIADKLSNLSYNCWLKKEYRNFSSNMFKSFKYGLTLNQFRNLTKVLIFPLIRNRYNST